MNKTYKNKRIFRVFYITTLSLIFTLMSCNKKENIELIVLNDSLKCIDNLDFTKLYSGNSKYDNLYDSLSTNIVKYKIHNNTNNKYVIVLDSNFFENYDEQNINFDSKNKNISINQINFSLYSNYVVRGKNSEDPNGNEYLEYKNYYNNILYQNRLDSIKLKKMFNISDNYISRNTNKIIKNNIILYPNETKYFTTIINLPLRHYRYNSLPWKTKIEKNKTYQAGLTLYNVAKETRKYLSPDLKKEIAENGYTIFDGVVQSNKVPVKMVNLPAE